MTGLAGKRLLAPGRDVLRVRCGGKESGSESRRRGERGSGNATSGHQGW
jgi:hypothetical protein